MYDGYHRVILICIPLLMSSFCYVSTVIQTPLFMFAWQPSFRKSYLPWSYM